MVVILWIPTYPDHYNSWILVILDPDILTIESNTFKSLTNLTSLYLNGNPLRFINKMAFLGLVNLKILELANTSLTAIDKDLLSCLLSSAFD